MVLQKSGNILLNLDNYKTNIQISRKIPDIDTLAAGLSSDISKNALIIADENTISIADKICNGVNLPLVVLKSTEEKKWPSVETILSAAVDSNVDRDGVFIGVGGGVICDLTSFAASIYKRGCRLVLVSTTLLGMVDASVGGKTGIDLFGIKNLAGSFYPAENVYLPIDALCTLPQYEWKSGFAELIKTAVLEGDDFIDQLDYSKLQDFDTLQTCIERAVRFKGSIVSEDLREAGKRKLLNLGHTFGHALESTVGLGNITHGEAVAWGMVQACKLGVALGITPPPRAQKITSLIESFGFECKCFYPLLTTNFFDAIKNDKKKKDGKLTFIVPDEKSAISVTIENEKEMEILKSILTSGTIK
jgi:3-dehydroquinate synthase